MFNSIEKKHQNPVKSVQLSELPEFTPTSDPPQNPVKSVQLSDYLNLLQLLILPKTL